MNDGLAGALSLGLPPSVAGDGSGRPVRAPVAATRQAAEDFEAVFLSQMFANMFNTVEDDGPFSGGSGEKMFQGHLHEEMGRAMARAGGVGIADAVQREMLALQEV